MRARRRRAHSRRQDGIVFQPGGGLLLNSGDEGGDSEDSTDGQQQTASPTSDQSDTASGNQDSATGRLQTQSVSIVSFESQPSSFGTSSTPAIATILFAPSPLGVVVSVTMPVSPSSSSSSVQSSLSSSPMQSSSTSVQYSSSSFERLTALPSTSSLLSSMPATTTATSSGSQSSSTASSASVVDAAGHSTIFYASIVFVAIVALACLVSFAAWLLRSQRKRPTWCGGGREDEDVESQDLGFGLGLYLDKPTNGFDSLKVSSTPLPESARSSSQTNPFVLPAFQGFANSPGRYPTTATRPAAPHSRTDDTVQSPNQLLGPLRIKNYVSGDFPSSCDEAVLSPNLGASFISEVDTPLEPDPVVTPRFSGLEGQGLSVPWAPLNIKSSRAPSQVNIAHSPSKKSVVAQTESEEERPALPMPSFGYALTQKEGELRSSDGWGATLRSSICNALSGLSGGAPKPEEDKFTTLPASRSRSNRWRNALSSRISGCADMATPEPRSGSVCDMRMGSKTIDSSLPSFQPVPGVVSPSSVALGMHLGEQDDGSRAAFTGSTTPSILSKKRATKTRSKLRSGSVKSRTISRANSFHFPYLDAARQSSQRAPKGSKRGSVLAQSSLLARPRPDFLRQASADSVTSFSSEASETSRDLTNEELRAKRTMMLRARRKRGMGMGSGTGRRLTISNALSRQSSGAAPSRGHETPRCGRQAVTVAEFNHCDTAGQSSDSI